MLADRVLRWTLWTMVCVAPLPFGAAPPWAWAVLACALAAVLTAWGIGLALRRLGWRAAARPAGWAYVGGGVVLLGVALQFVPGVPGRIRRGPPCRAGTRWRGRSAPRRRRPARHWRGSA